MSQTAAGGYFQNVDTMDEYSCQESAMKNADGMGTLSKQFQPKKFKDGNKLWNKEIEQGQSYSYTPFRSTTLSKSQTTPKPTRDSVHTGTLRPPKANPFVYDPPSAPSTPKMTRARPGSSAATLTREQKLTWGRAPPPQHQHHHQHFRSVSAMSHGRTLPRPSEFSPMPPQRHPSIATLPRGEPIDAYCIPPPPLHMISRPPSSMAAPATPLASNLPVFVPPSPKAVARQLSLTPTDVNWNRVSLICCMQVICCITMFGVGVARVLSGALWAIGVENVFATGALIPALAGIYAVKTGNYSAAMFAFLANALQMMLALAPFLIGMFPLVPHLFPKVHESWLVSPTEPIHLDLILSFLVALQTLLAFHLAIMGCKAIGSAMSTIDELKLQSSMRAAFEDADGIPYKSVA
ncbi:unnamed protein product [Caenorhabditis bovis]|uniref:Uncharacterized protein n=1 Tax=Caenorhabditis bovis TaxID=2654633 RepID=A0A8S1EAS6_9PELO|nr:unnamed protein product [Caenorhabditis bovis]